MSDCCSEKKRDEMRLFVRQKAVNFKKMLEPFCKSPEHQMFLAKYDESQVEDVVMTYLSPFYKTNSLGVARDMVVNQLSISDKEVIEKIERYLQCFCECLL